MPKRPQNTKNTTLINKTWFEEHRKKGLYGFVNVDTCKEYLQGCKGSDGIFAKKILKQLNTGKLQLKFKADLNKFFVIIASHEAKTVEKWFYNVDDANWLGVDDCSMERICFAFNVKEVECKVVFKDNEDEILFFKGYDYKRFLNILLTSANLKFYPVEKAAISIMMREPFKYFSIENIMSIARENDPRFNASKRLQNRLEMHTAKSPQCTGLELYEKNDSEEYRLILKNVVQYLEQAPE